MSRPVFGVDRQSRKDAETAEAWMPREPVPPIGALPSDALDKGVPWVLVDGVWHLFRSSLTLTTDCFVDFGASNRTVILPHGEYPEGPRCGRTRCRLR